MHRRSGSTLITLLSTLVLLGTLIIPVAAHAAVVTHEYGIHTSSSYPTGITAGARGKKGR